MSTEGSHMDSKNQRESRPEELVIPLWEEVGPSCPMDKERQRNPDALDRHVPAATGVAPPEESPRQQPPEKMVRLWLESEK